MALLNAICAKNLKIFLTKEGATSSVINQNIVVNDGWYKMVNLTYDGEADCLLSKSRALYLEVEMES